MELGLDLSDSRADLRRTLVIKISNASGKRSSATWQRIEKPSDYFTGFAQLCSMQCSGSRDSLPSSISLLLFSSMKEEEEWPRLEMWRGQCVVARKRVIRMHASPTQNLKSSYVLGIPIRGFILIYKKNACFFKKIIWFLFHSIAGLCSFDEIFHYIFAHSQVEKSDSGQYWNSTAPVVNKQKGRYWTVGIGPTVGAVLI